MNNENIAQKGEQLTFHKLFADKQWKVEIPIIQRDYAQGRKSAREVRESFLDTLNKHLQDIEKINLDFIYGSLEEDNHELLFIPLDGQQRLTTLFLLHWYLANKENRQDEFRKFLVSDEGKSNFTYETRASVREFCDELVNCILDYNNLKEPDEGKHNSLSKTIEDQTWYFLSWRNDPTIQAMLIMLDDIHNKFNGSNNYYEKLIDKNNPVITFQFLDLENFGLTDDLYIKMNARGKPLTAFENFKAKFEQLIKELEIKKDYQLQIGNESRTVSAHEYFSHKIDTEWTDIFWNYRNTLSNDNTFDDEIMNFIRVVITNYYAINTSHKKRTENLQLLFGNDEGDNHLSYLQYKELDCLDEELVKDLIALFDLLSDGEKIKTYLEDTSYYDEEKVFKSALLNETGYGDKLRFYALYIYLIYNETKTGINDWMRVIYNLTENLIYDSPDDYVRSLRSIKQLIPNSHSILTYLSDPNNKISGFGELQIKEEKIKAILMLKDNEWREAIINAEQHEYFTGQIGFMLNYSGIEEYYNKNKALNWTEDENANYLSSFKSYSVKAKTIFNYDTFKSLNNYVWERALLTKGDYLLKEGSNLSFCTDDKDRDISWKRLLLDGGKRKDHPGHIYRRNLVKNLFDDNEFNSSNLQESLESIIENHQGNEWYKSFIDNPALFNYLGRKKYIRKESESKIYLLKRERLSGSHAELYSYLFYINYLKDKKNELSPFAKTRYNDPSGIEEDPSAVIYDWVYNNKNYQINIWYIPKDNQFEIHFNAMPIEKSEIDDEVKDKIDGLGDWDVHPKNHTYIIKKKDIKESISFLEKLFTELRKLLS
jgi:hypothetical protein